MNVIVNFSMVLSGNHMMRLEMIGYSLQELLGGGRGHSPFMYIVCTFSSLSNTCGHCLIVHSHSILPP